MTTLKFLNKLVLDSIHIAHESNDQPTLKAMGVSVDDARMVAELTAKERNEILEKDMNVVSVQVDIMMLRALIDKCQEQYRREQSLRDAILLGATRDIMYLYAKMSYKQFTLMRRQLNIEEANNSRLNDDQIMILNQVIQQDIQSIQNNERFRVTLQYLTDLSKHTKLPISSIYSHISSVWGEKYDLR